MAGKWIPCDERLPEIGKCVIAFDPELWCECGEGFNGAGSNGGEWWGDRWIVSGGTANVTHWMPFPSPPTGGTDGR
jgi:hypothetical protein